MRAAIAFLALAIPVMAGTIIPNNHPNYPPQLPNGEIQFDPFAIPLSDLQQQFPQSDYAQYAGLTCYFDTVNPAKHDVCAPPLFPWLPAAYPVPYIAPPVIAVVTPQTPEIPHAVSNPLIGMEPCIPVAPASVPEPGTLWLVVPGVALLALFSGARRFF